MASEPSDRVDLGFVDGSTDDPKPNCVGWKMPLQEAVVWIVRVREKTFCGFESRWPS